MAVTQRLEPRRTTYCADRACLTLYHSLAETCVCTRTNISVSLKFRAMAEPCAMNRQVLSIVSLERVTADVRKGRKLEWRLVSEWSLPAPKHGLVNLHLLSRQLFVNAVTVANVPT
jgi:hypothetical protein